MYMYLCMTRLIFLQRRPKHVRLHGRARGAEALRVCSVLQPREHGLHARRELRGQAGSVRCAGASARVGGGEALQHLGNHLARKLLHVRRLGDGGSRGSGRCIGSRAGKKIPRSREIRGGTRESTCQRTEGTKQVSAIDETRQGTPHQTSINRKESRAQPATRPAIKTHPPCPWSPSLLLPPRWRRRGPRRPLPPRPRAARDPHSPRNQSQSARSWRDA